jgi:hypothetical protein
MKEIKTIQEAKDFLADNYEKGTKCPCCDQTVKMYNFKLSKGMALVLVKMYKLRHGDWLHPVKDLNTPSGDYAKLRHWGLITRSVDPDKKGLWRITEQGEFFIGGDMKVQEKIRLYNGKFYGCIGEWITIKQALTNKFNLNELLNN